MFSSSSDDSEAASESSVDTVQSESFLHQDWDKKLWELTSGDEVREPMYCDGDCEGCPMCAEKHIEQYEREMAASARMTLSGQSGGEPIFHYGVVGGVSRWGLTEWLGSRAHEEISWPMMVGDFLADKVVPTGAYKLLEWSVHVEYRGEVVPAPVVVALPSDLAELVRNFDDKVLVRDGAVRDHLRRLFLAASQFARGDGQQKCVRLVPEAVLRLVGKINGLRFVPDRPVEAAEVPSIEVMSVSEFEKLVPSVVDWEQQQDWREGLIKIDVAENKIVVEGRTKYLEAALIHENFTRSGGKWEHDWSGTLITRMRRWGNGSFDLGFSEEVRRRMTEQL
jgi:hypothetical protein